MEFYDFPYIGNVIIPTDFRISFRVVGIPPTSYLFSIIIIWDNPSHWRTPSFFQDDYCTTNQMMLLQPKSKYVSDWGYIYIIYIYIYWVWKHHFLWLTEVAESSFLLVFRMKVRGQSSHILGLWWSHQSVDFQPRFYGGILAYFGHHRTSLAKKIPIPQHTYNWALKA